MDERASDSMLVMLIKMNFASFNLVLRSSTRGLSLLLKSCTAELIESTHSNPPVLNMSISAGMQPKEPSPNTAIFLAPYTYKVKILHPKQN